MKAINPVEVVLDISSTKEGDDCVITLRGDLDISTSEKLEEVFAASLNTATRIIIDMAGVPFADSSGLGGLIAAYKKAAAAGKEVRLRRPTPIVSEILTITRMKRFFPVDE